MKALFKSLKAYTPVTLIFLSVSTESFASPRVITLPTAASVASVENNNSLSQFASRVLNTALNTDDLSVLSGQYGFSGCLPTGPQTPDFTMKMANAGVICELRAKEKGEVSGKTPNRPWKSVDPQILKASLQKQLGTRALYSFSLDNDSLKSFVEGTVDLSFPLQDNRAELERKPKYSLRVSRTPYPTSTQAVVEDMTQARDEGEELSMTEVKEIVEQWDEEPIAEKRDDFVEEESIGQLVHRELGLAVKPFDTVKMRFTRKGTSWGFSNVAIRVEEGAGLLFVEGTLETYGAGLKLPIKNSTLEVATVDITKKPTIKYTIWGAHSSGQVQYNFESQEVWVGVSIAI